MVYVYTYLVLGFQELSQEKCTQLQEFSFRYIHTCTTYVSIYYYILVFCFYRPVQTYENCERDTRKPRYTTRIESRYVDLIISRGNHVLLNFHVRHAYDSIVNECARIRMWMNMHGEEK